MSLCHHRVDAPSLALSPHSSLSRAARQYDRVFAPHCAQETVFDAVQPLVVSVLDGYNVCVFAYGQTGSGKTFTIEGTADDPGVSPRAVAELFRIVGERSPDWSFTVTMCMMEVLLPAACQLTRRPPRPAAPPCAFLSSHRPLLPSSRPIMYL